MCLQFVFHTDAFLPKLANIFKVSLQDIMYKEDGERSCGCQAGSVSMCVWCSCSMYI